MLSLIDEIILVDGSEDISSYTTSMSMPAAVLRSEVLDTLLGESLPGIEVECLEKALTGVMRQYKKWLILWLEIMGELLLIPRIALCLTNQVPPTGSSAARLKDIRGKQRLSVIGEHHQSRSDRWKMVVELRNIVAN